MIMTILEANVSQDKSQILIYAFRQQIAAIPPEIVHTYLAHDSKNPAIWRIITVWKSKEALGEMRKQGTPAGVMMFRQVNSEPTLSLYEIVESSSK